MKQCHIRILSVVAVLGALSTLSACTSSSSVVNSSPSTPSSSKGSGVGTAGKGVFSSLSELHYTPTAEGAYRIAPNDLIEISVPRAPEFSQLKRRVDQNGRISINHAGVMKVAGLTQEQLEKLIAQRLSSVLQNPHVDVFVNEQTSREVTVGGRVKRAGVFPLKSATTVSQAVAMAGGLEELADPTNVVLFRPSKGGQFKAYHLDLKAIRAGNLRDPYVTGKDQIIAHESGSRVMMGRVLQGIRGVFSPFSF
ncbi:MAG: polysaccharide biosynthesis/export family protein [Thiotrichaceae bacterium]